MLASGHSFAGHTLVRPLAEGGDCDVWLGEADGECVAIRVSKPPETNRPARWQDVLDRFSKRVEDAKQLDHPNIVKVIDGGEQDGLLYVVTELVDGVDLEQAFEQLKREGKWISESTAVYLAERVAAALGHAHERALPHCGLAPSKIIIAADGAVMVSDFAALPISQVQASTARRQSTTNKLAYLSPELTKTPEAGDARSDVFALGAIFWEMLTSEPLFKRESDLDTIVAITDEVVPTAPETVREGLRNVLARCLERTPTERFESGLAVVDALQEITVPPVDEEELESLARLPRRKSHAAPWEVGDPLDTRAAQAKTRQILDSGEVNSLAPDGPRRRFEILSRIGEGGMGEVYRARDRELEEIVALKVMARHLAADQDLIERMRREVRLARKIASERVCRIYDLVELEDGSRAIAMQFVEGRTLSELIDEGVPTDYARFAKWGADIADGLAAAHALSVVHRDLKPDNIMIDEHDHAVILDFGIAYSNASDDQDSKLTKKGVILGTLPYMAPEQLTARALDGRTDLYALGLILAELVTAEVPFDAPDYSGLLERRVIHPEAYALNLKDPGAPTGLAEVVDKLVLARPEDRIALADDVARALRAVAHEFDTGPVDTRVDGAPARVPTAPIEEVVFEPTPLDEPATEPPASGLPGYIALGLGLLLFGVGMVLFGRVLDGRKPAPTEVERPTVELEREAGADSKPGEEAKPAGPTERKATERKATVPALKPTKPKPKPTKRTRELAPAEPM